MHEINQKFVSVKMPKLSLRACLHGGGAPSKEAMKTCSVWSRHRDQYQSDNRDPNDKTKPFKQQIT